MHNQNLDVFSVWTSEWILFHLLKNICYKIHTLWSTSNANLGNFGFEIIQAGHLIEYLRYSILGQKLNIWCWTDWWGHKLQSRSYTLKYGRHGASFALEAKLILQRRRCRKESKGNFRALLTFLDLRTSKFLKE